MDYEFDIFISYRRSPTIGPWVCNHLHERLKARLNEIAPRDVRIAFDEDMDNGVALTEELRRRVRASTILLAVWSADYFRSRWCMTEWGSFRAREQLLGLASAGDPSSLIYPVRYADGDYFHPDARAALCKRDFSGLTYPDEAFKQTPKYLEFDDMVRQMAADLAQRLANPPAWRDDFPIEEPEPMPPPGGWRVSL